MENKKSDARNKPKYVIKRLLRLCHRSTHATS